MSTRLSLRVQERITELTSSEQKLAQVILKTPTVIETHSATDLALMAGVSKATAARFFRNLGYRDFEEVRLQARDERNLSQPFAYAAGTPANNTPGRLIAEHLELEQDNLRRSFEEMQPETLRNAARLIQSAPRLWCLGHGSDGWLAAYARQLFARLRPNVFVLGSNHSVVEDLAMVGAGDAMILPLLGAQPKSLRPILTHAGAARVAMITVCDYENLALAQRHDMASLPCHVARYGGAVQTHTTALSMLRLLAISFADLARDTAGPRLRLIENLTDELELYEN